MNINSLIKRYEEDEKRICEQGYEDYNVVESIVHNLKTLQKEQREWIEENKETLDIPWHWSGEIINPDNITEAFGLEEE